MISPQSSNQAVKTTVVLVGPRAVPNIKREIQHVCIFAIVNSNLMSSQPHHLHVENGVCPVIGQQALTLAIDISNL